MSPPPEVIALAGPLLERSLVFQTGSHMYGLNTPDSDVDWTLIYFDPVDHRRLFRHHPDVLHSDGNDHKLYSLAKFAGLVAKGNPNSAELAANLGPALPVHTRPCAPDVQVIQNFLFTVRPHLVTRALAAAYLGHLSGIQKELRTKGVTPKRLSHAIRMADCAGGLLRTRHVPDYRLDPGSLVSLAVKLGQMSPDEAARHLAGLEVEAGQLYADVKDDLPDGSRLQEVINDFFINLS